MATNIKPYPTADVGKVETRQERFLEIFPRTVRMMADDAIDLCPNCGAKIDEEDENDQSND